MAGREKKRARVDKEEEAVEEGVEEEAQVPVSEELHPLVGVQQKERGLAKEEESMEEEVTRSILLDYLKGKQRIAAVVEVEQVGELAGNETLSSASNAHLESSITPKPESTKWGGTHPRLKSCSATTAVRNRKPKRASGEMSCTGGEELRFIISLKKDEATVNFTREDNPANFGFRTDDVPHPQIVRSESFASHDDDPFIAIQQLGITALAIRSKIKLENLPDINLCSICRVIAVSELAGFEKIATYLTSRERAAVVKLNPDGDEDWPLFLIPVKLLSSSKLSPSWQNWRERFSKEMRNDSRLVAVVQTRGFAAGARGEVSDLHANQQHLSATGVAPQFAC